MDYSPITPSPTTSAMGQQLQAAAELWSGPTIILSPGNLEILWSNSAARDFLSPALLTAELASCLTLDDQRILRTLVDEPNEGRTVEVHIRSPTRETDVRRFRCCYVERAIVAVGPPTSLTERIGYVGPLDALTGVGSRAALEACLQASIRGGHHDWGVLFIDLDNYKRVNDLLGHLAGDEVLLEFAEKLRVSARPTDQVFRFGGDEFMVVVHRIESASVLQRIAARIRDDVFVRVQRTSNLMVTASIGCAMAWSTLRHPAEIIDRADRDMYRVKNGS